MLPNPFISLQPMIRIRCRVKKKKMKTVTEDKTVNPAIFSDWQTMFLSPHAVVGENVTWRNEEALMEH